MHFIVDSVQSKLLKMFEVGLAALFIGSVCFSVTPLKAEEKSPYEDMAFELTALFRAYRATITLDKKRIHEPAIYFTKENIDKRVKDMHAEVKLKYKSMTSKDYPIDRFSFKGSTRVKLEKSFEKKLRDYVAGKLSLKWQGKNRFVKRWDGKMLPARFASYAAAYFNKESEGRILIKLTTTRALLVNVKNGPDEWENTVINKMINKTKQTNKPFVTKRESNQYRFLIPEYYAQGCIQCHGTKKGQFGYDIHPTKIKRKLSDLGGAISIIFKY